MKYLINKIDEINKREDEFLQKQADGGDWYKDTFDFAFRDLRSSVDAVFIAFFVAIVETVEAWRNG